MLRKEDFEQARLNLQGIINKTALQFSETLSRLTGCGVYLKPENLQKTGSFKIRGSYNEISRFSEEEKRRGIIAISAGNHAQGVAYASRLLGARAVVVMPENAFRSKVEAVKGYGAEVVLHGEDSEELYNKAGELQKLHGYTFVYDDYGERVLAGTGTIALEILDEKPQAKAILVPVGAGGLIAGMAVAAKLFRPRVKVLGVQAKGAPSMYLSLKAGRPTAINKIETIADGLAVKTVRQYAFDIVKEYVDDILLVDDEEISEAMVWLLQRAKLLVEPSGAVGIAALLSGRSGLAGGDVVALLSGGNVELELVARLTAKR